MRKFSTNGTLGDAYISVVKLYNLSKTEQVQVYHHPKHRSWDNMIVQIYSLLPNITVTLMDQMETVHTRIYPSFNKKGRGKLVIEPFPKFEMTNNPHLIECSENGVDFVCVSPRSGKEHELPETILRYIAKHNKTLYIGSDVGTDPTYCDLNMMGCSQLLNSLGMIRQTNEFHGYQGLCCFFALSQKIRTTVYCKDETDVDAFYERVLPQWEPYIKEVSKL